MKYKMLRKFLGLLEGETSLIDNSHYAFSCGIGYYYSVSGLAITKGKSSQNMGNVAFILTVKDRSDNWRKKLAEHTSNADYDLIVRRIDE